MIRILWASIATTILATTAACGSCPPPEPAPVCPPPPQGCQETSEWVDLPMHILFATSSAELTRENRLVLDEAIAAVRARNDISQVEIRGHADTRGNAEANMRLSEQRAEAVRSYLVSQGVPATMLSTQAFSEDQPRDSVESLNRRVDFRTLLTRCQ